MAIGPGKYDDLCKYVREKSGGVGAIVIVFNGQFGFGFDVQAPPAVILGIPEVLEEVARQIRKDRDSATDWEDFLGKVP